VAQQCRPPVVWDPGRDTTLTPAQTRVLWAEQRLPSPLDAGRLTGRAGRVLGSHQDLESITGEHVTWCLAWCAVPAAYSTIERCWRSSIGVLQVPGLCRPPHAWDLGRGTTLTPAQTWVLWAEQHLRSRWGADRLRGRVGRLLGSHLDRESTTGEHVAGMLSVPFVPLPLIWCWDCGTRCVVGVSHVGIRSTCSAGVSSLVRHNSCKMLPTKQRVISRCCNYVHRHALLMYAFP
jgi:hypothetical protein